MQMKNRALIKEILISAVVLTVITISFLADVSIILIPDFLNLTFQNREDLFLTLFSVQASVSTISIAIVSIITGVLNDTIYGISVSQYVTSLRFRIFNHKTLIIASLILVLLNYLCVSYTLFNCSISLFAVSIAINILLVHNVCAIFMGKESIKFSILNYLAHNYNERFIMNLTTETMDAIDSGASLIVKRNYEAYKAIFMAETENSDYQETKIINQLSHAIGDIFEKTVKRHDSRSTYDSILFICDIYDIANKKVNAPLYLIIWDYISVLYFVGIKDLTFEQLRDEHVYWKLRRKLYDNITTRSSQQLAECNLKFYSARLCSALFSNADEFSSDEIKRIKSEVYETAYYCAVSKDEPNEAIQDIYVKEVCYLHKYFIDNCDGDAITNFYFTKLSYRRSNSDAIKIYLITLIYLYYLSSREPLVNDTAIKACALKILKTNEDVNCCFYFDLNILQVTKEMYKYIQPFMENWEYMEAGKAKWMIMDTVIQDFFFYTALCKSWEEDILADAVNNIISEISDGVFVVYSRYFSDDNMKYIKDGFQEFNEIFSSRLDDASLEDRILLLKSVLDEKYKEEELSDSSKNAITQEMLDTFERKCTASVKDIVQRDFSTFAFKEQTYNEQHNQITEKKNIPIVQSSVSAFLLGKNGFDSYFLPFIRQQIVTFFIETIRPHVKYKEFSYKDRNKQQYLVDNIKTLNIDTVIGDKNKRWNEEDKTLLYNVISDVKELKYPKMNNYYFVIDSKLIEFSIDNVKVTFSDVELDAVSNECQIDDSGKILFNVVNNYFIPFEESELKEYLHNTRRIVTILADIKYRFSKDIVGAGLKIVSD